MHTEKELEHGSLFILDSQNAQAQVKHMIAVAHVLPMQLKTDISSPLSLYFCSIAEQSAFYGVYDKTLPP